MQLLKGSLPVRGKGLTHLLEKSLNLLSACHADTRLNIREEVV